MKSKIVASKMRATDVKDILSAGYPFSTAEFGSVYKDWKSKMCGTLEQLETRRLVAYCQDEKKSVGIVTLKEINTNLWGIRKTFVSPSHRRRGISHLLYRASFSYLRRKGVKKAVGDVEVNNIASIKGIRKTWDRFLSQEYYKCCGDISHVPQENRKGISIRKFRSSDRNALFHIYTECACEDWRSFLEIDKSNFLERFIEHSFRRGLLKLLFKKRILIAEEHEGTLKGYAIIFNTRLPIRGNTPTLYFFISPQLSLQEVMEVFKELSRVLFLEGFRDLHVISINRNEKLMCNLLDMLSTNLGFKTSRYLTCTKTLT